MCGILHPAPLGSIFHHSVYVYIDIMTSLHITHSLNKFHTLFVLVSCLSPSLQPPEEPSYCSEDSKTHRRRTHSHPVIIRGAEENQGYHPPDQNHHKTSEDRRLHSKKFFAHQIVQSKSLLFKHKALVFH